MVKVTLPWVLGVLAATVVVVALAYVSALSGLRTGVVEAHPPRSAVGNAQQPPTLFGTVASFDGSVMKVDSKQPYNEVIIGSDTTISDVSGQSAMPGSIEPGVVVTATGKDLGNGRLAAIAVVILENR